MNNYMLLNKKEIIDALKIALDNKYINVKNITTYIKDDAIDSVSFEYDALREIKEEKVEPVLWVDGESEGQIFIVLNDGRIFLRGKLIAEDKELADIFAKY